jgi:tRNA U34 5-methylaminomethyl-2-thiouridine-forming methyltransferase MnmC
MSSKSIGAIQIEQTSDGSLTLRDLETGSTYHSRHGARTESEHVFIDAGLRLKLQLNPTKLSVLEMGFGTGLNAFLTAQFIQGKHVDVAYEALEVFPLEEQLWSEVVKNESVNPILFRAIHQAKWGVSNILTPDFTLTKHLLKVQDFRTKTRFDLIYYDAFEPDVQPELWSKEIFEMLFDITATQGVLVTYCAKGQVRRNLQAAGFVVERIPGPPFKREMLRATRP